MKPVESNALLAADALLQRLKVQLKNAARDLRRIKETITRTNEVIRESRETIVRTDALIQADGVLK